ncbi:MAG: hypothetical protein WA253_07310 [Gammaproteobacteria bacterium]
MPGILNPDMIESLNPHREPYCTADQIVEKLGGKIYAVDEIEGWTLLHWAILKQRFDVVDRWRDAEALEEKNKQSEAVQRYNDNPQNVVPNLDRICFSAANKKILDYLYLFITHTSSKSAFLKRDIFSYLCIAICTNDRFSFKKLISNENPEIYKSIVEVLKDHGRWFYKHLVRTESQFFIVSNMFSDVADVAASDKDNIRITRLMHDMNTYSCARSLFDDLTTVFWMERINAMRMIIEKAPPALLSQVLSVDSNFLDGVRSYIPAFFFQTLCLLTKKSLQSVEEINIGAVDFSGFAELTDLDELDYDLVGINVKNCKGIESAKWLPAMKDRMLSSLRATIKKIDDLDGLRDIFRLNQNGILFIHRGGDLSIFPASTWESMSPDVLDALPRSARKLIGYLKDREKELLQQNAAPSASLPQLSQLWSSPVEEKMVLVSARELERLRQLERNINRMQNK